VVELTRYIVVLPLVILGVIALGALGSGIASSFGESYSPPAFSKTSSGVKNISADLKSTVENADWSNPVTSIWAVPAAGIEGLKLLFKVPGLFFDAISELVASVSIALPKDAVEMIMAFFAVVVSLSILGIIIRYKLS
jgi:hypothetical protein